MSVLEAVMKEAALVFRQITGLRMEDNPAGSIVPPAGYVSYPLSIDYALVYGHGSWKFNQLPITLLAGKVTGRSARDKISAWCASDGQGVKALAEAHDWASCDDFTVTGATFDIETVAGVDYLAVIFTADLVGTE